MDRTGVRVSPRSSLFGIRRGPAVAMAAIALLPACASAPRATPAAWNALGPQQDLGDGITPGIAVDRRGDVHIVYMGGKRISYRKGDSQLRFGPAEAIPVPAGPGNYNSPCVVADANGIPHVAFVKDAAGTSKRGWYTNRIGGSWKPPVEVFGIDLTNNPKDLRVNYPRMALAEPYAFVGAITGNPGGRLCRVTDLDTTPRADKFVDNTLMTSRPVVDMTGRLFAVGRNGPAGQFLQEYDLDLKPVGRPRKLNQGQPKTGEPVGACVDSKNVVHAAGWIGGIGEKDPARLYYMNSRRLDAGAPCIVAPPFPINPHTEGQNFPDPVYPDMAVDAFDRVYITYRDFVTGEVDVTLIDGDKFSPLVSFGPVEAEHSRFNHSIAPAAGGGVYIAWDDGKTVYIRAVGVGTGEGSR